MNQLHILISLNNISKIIRKYFFLIPAFQFLGSCQIDKHTEIIATY